ncbi:MAG: LD-carboxypeptidase [Lentisphaeria bacterium]|nr:LD-carboxypeptidase [Lentisphaeria bacterium]
MTIHTCPFPGTVRKIGICTPSKRVEPEQIAAVAALLEQWGIAYTLAPDAMTAGEEDYFAADAVRRADDFNTLLQDESIDLILCSRGGYGAAYILPLIDWELLKKRNLPVIGYSDITALHLAMLARGAGRPVAARMATHLPDIAADPYSCDSMRRALAGIPSEPLALTPVISSVISSVTGDFVPVNLTVLASLCGSQWLPDWSGKILALEDIDEEPRKIDRMLLQLDLAGIFDFATAVVFGDFSGECGTAEERKRIFKRFAERHPGTPFFAGLPFGHALPSLSFAIGSSVTIRQDGTMTY